MHLPRKIPLVLCLITLAACGKWPPQFENISDHIESSRERFRELETILIDSGYDVISRSIVEDQVNVQSGRGQEATNETLDEKKAWNELLNQTKAFHIEKREGGFWYLAGTAESGKYSATVAYVHDPLADTKYKACTPEHGRNDCGECVAKVNQEWWVYYWWYPDDLPTEEYSQCVRDGSLPPNHDAGGF